MEINEAYASLAAQLQKLLKGLSLADAHALADGSAKVVLLQPGSKIVSESATLELALKAVKNISDQDLEKIVGGGSSLKLVHKGGRVTYPVRHGEIAQEVSQLFTEDAIIKFLDADDRLKPADLKKIANELGINMPKDAKELPQMQTHIARSLIAFGITSR
jgi:hypothetical protein